MPYDQLKHYRHAHYHQGRPLDNQYGKQFPNTKLPRERRIELYHRFKDGETLESLYTQYGLSVHRVKAIVSHFRRVYE